MAHRPDLRTCDVASALDGKDVIGTEKVKVEYPASLTASGKKEHVEFDVSPDGKLRVEKMVEKALAEVAKAYGDLNDLRAKVGK
jgi:malate/lactate dehydrogenase